VLAAGNYIIANQHSVARARTQKIQWVLLGKPKHKTHLKLNSVLVFHSTNNGIFITVKLLKVLNL